MKTINNKKVLMSLSALLILIFHLWIQVIPGFKAEAFIVKSGYIGVDIFFLLSAYSLASREVKDAKSFYLSRFRNVYLKFVAFTVVMAIISRWNVLRFVKAVVGIELFERGGGAFLWFLPAIMLLYLLYPLMQKPLRSKPLAFCLIGLMCWFALGLALSEFTSIKTIFIFFNRIPVILTGFLIALYDDKIACFLKGRRLVVGLPLLMSGLVLVYFFGFNSKLSKPIIDMFYCLALPLVLGIIILLDGVKDGKISKLIGSCTLEAYGLQMVFGFKLVGKIYKLMGSALLTNVLCIIILLSLSVCLSNVFRKLIK